MLSARLTDLAAGAARTLLGLADALFRRFGTGRVPDRVSITPLPPVLDEVHGILGAIRSEDPSPHFFFAAGFLAVVFFAVVFLAAGFAAAFFAGAFLVVAFFGMLPS